MKSTYAKWLIAGVAASLALSAHAQQRAGESADELLNDANTVLRQLDAGQFTDVWANAAAFVKRSIKQDEFVAEMRSARQMVGAVQHRGWAQVTRIQSNKAGNLPDGLYANVDFATTLTTSAKMYEKLSFRLDGDGRWHLTGYVPRK